MFTIKLQKLGMTCFSLIMDKFIHNYFVVGTVETKIFKN